MGITISCKRTGSSIDMGYGGFCRLREKIAEVYGEEFERHYKLTSDVGVMLLMGDERKRYFDEYNRKTSEMIAAKKLNAKLANFCYQSDCGGSVRYGACKVIYAAIKDYDDDVLYGYAGLPDCAKFSDFKAIVKECCDTKSDLVWS
jgi:hypothetical protein